MREKPDQLARKKKSNDRTSVANDRSTSIATSIISRAAHMQTTFSADILGDLASQAHFPQPRAGTACNSCNKHKIKCEHDGTLMNACAACIRYSRQCDYRRKLDLAESSSKVAQNARRKRTRLDPSAVVTPRSIAALEPQVLTINVWKELFDIFQLHYSVQLPFLHRALFLDPLEHGATRPPGTDAFLLAFLTLTARYCDRLVRYHSPPKSGSRNDPTAATEFYAAAAHQRYHICFGNYVAHIEATQTQLMLSYHYYGSFLGNAGWMALGSAIRGAQVLNLHLPANNLSASSVRGIEGSSTDPRYAELPVFYDTATPSQTREGVRRTWWTCFIGDKLFSDRTARPAAIQAEDIEIPLPISERSFTFDLDAVTAKLVERSSDVVTREKSVAAIMADHEDERLIELGAKEGDLARYIRMVKIFGDVAKWSRSGGRRQENETWPPWDERSAWSKLCASCEHFNASLTIENAMSARNTHAHIHAQTSTIYLTAHLHHLVCQILLHREWVPFLALRCDMPIGPLDPPQLPQDGMPPAFFRDSAQQLFKAARDIISTAYICFQRNALPGNTVIGFSIYLAAFVGAYSEAFPHMDEQSHMRRTPRDSPDLALGKEARIMLEWMAPHMRAAHGWLKVLDSLLEYMLSRKQKFEQDPDQYAAIVANKPSPGGRSEWEHIEELLLPGVTNDEKSLRNLAQLSLQSSDEDSEGEVSSQTSVTSDHEVSPTGPYDKPAHTALQSYDFGQQRNERQQSFSTSLPSESISGSQRTSDSPQERSRTSNAALDNTTTSPNTSLQISSAMGVRFPLPEAYMRMQNMLTGNSMAPSGDNLCSGTSVESASTFATSDASTTRTTELTASNRTSLQPQWSSYTMNEVRQGSIGSMSGTVIPAPEHVYETIPQYSTTQPEMRSEQISLPFQFGRPPIVVQDLQHNWRPASTTYMHSQQVALGSDDLQMFQSGADASQCIEQMYAVQGGPQEGTWIPVIFDNQHDIQ